MLLLRAEPAQECSNRLREAVGAIVEIHVARALQALQCGFQKIEAFRKDFDPRLNS